VSEVIARFYTAEPGVSRCERQGFVCSQEIIDQEEPVTEWLLVHKFASVTEVELDKFQYIIFLQADTELDVDEDDDMFYHYAVIDIDRENKSSSGSSSRRDSDQVIWDSEDENYIFKSRVQEFYT
jgi:hypothetical protein